MVILQNIKATFKVALILTIFFTISLQANFIYEGDNLINEKALNKMQEMGDELYQKTGVSTVIIAKQHLSKEQFLQIKDKYLKELKNPYVLWIFSKSYMDKAKIGINQMFNSEDLENKFDKDSLFSPWGGTFTKLIAIQKSDSDPTAAAFLNGYGDLTDMIATSYGIKLDSSIGSETKTTINIVRVIFYTTIVFFLLWYLRVKFKKRSSS